MRGFVFSVVLVALLSNDAHAGTLFGCCICGQPGARPLFCATVPDGEIDQFDAQCEMQGGIPQPCLAVTTPDACDNDFAQAGCNPVTAAPAIGTTILLATAALLGGVGALTLRQRRPPPRL